MQIEELASLIVYHRKRAHLSQAGLACHAGVSRYVVQDLEAGGGRTTWRRLKAVLDVLNVTLRPEGPLVGEWRRGLTPEDPPKELESPKGGAE